MNACPGSPAVPSGALPAETGRERSVPTRSLPCPSAGAPSALRPFGLKRLEDPFALPAPQGPDDPAAAHVVLGGQGFNRVPVLPILKDGGPPQPGETPPRRRDAPAAEVEAELDHGLWPNERGQLADLEMAPGLGHWSEPCHQVYQSREVLWTPAFLDARLPGVLRCATASRPRDGRERSRQ